MSGISNFVIEKVINEIGDDLKQNFVGVFPSNHTFKLINFTHYVREKSAPFPFMIMNTDRSGKEGEHWWSLLELSSKGKVFLFDSFGFIGLKEFIIDNDKRIFDRSFYGIEKINKKDTKINLTYLQFDIEAYKKTNKHYLTPTAQNFFHTLNEFDKVHKNKIVDVYMVDDQLQNLKSDTCGIFQLYFYTNLFVPKNNSKIITNKALNLKTIETLLNEIFSLNISENEHLVETFAEEHNIERS